MTDILIDLQAVPSTPDGTATALKTLLPGLFSNNQSLNYYIAGNSDSLHFFLPKEHQNVKGNVWIKKQRNIISRVIKEFFFDFKKINELSPKIFFAPCTLVPYGIKQKTKTVSVIHDLAVFKVPNIYTNARTLYHKLLFKSIADGHVSHFTCVSRATQIDVQNILKIPSENITTIPHANPTPFYERKKDEIEYHRQNLKLPERYILFVGKLQPRKNLPRLIDAFSIISEYPSNNDLHLVIGGRFAWMTEDIKNKIYSSPARDRIIFTGEIPSNDLLWYYRCATVFSYISLYEGFGLPILEAMSAGVPVVTSNFGAMAEIADSNAILVDPLNVDSIADGINKIVQDELLQKKLRELGKERLKNFTLRKMVSEYNNLWKKLL